MDFFTESVDAALWTSRTYDDPTYEADASAAAESRAPIEVQWHNAASNTSESHPALPTHIIVSSSSAADAAVDALCPPEDRSPIATLSGAGVPSRTLSRCEDVGGILRGCATVSCSGVSAERGYMWACALREAVSSEAQIVVVTSVPCGRLRGSGKERKGVRVLASENVTMEGLLKLAEPDFVEGCEAAVVAEMECCEGGCRWVCVIGVTERANFEGGEVMEISKAVCQAVTALDGSAEWDGEKVMERVAKGSGRSAVAAHDSIYL